MTWSLKSYSLIPSTVIYGMADASYYNTDFQGAFSVQTYFRQWFLMTHSHPLTHSPEVVGSWFEVETAGNCGVTSFTEQELRL